MAILPIIEEWDVGLHSTDPLAFPGYAESLAAKVAASPSESVHTGRATAAVVIEGDFSFFGGSMGAAHGEKVVRAIDRAIELGLPVLVEARSGGARMQEGMVSLIQMARTAAAMGRLRAAGLGSVAVLHQPTTGGVFASYSSLCDLVGAEAGATVGFAGPRVAEAFTGESVEGRSHTAETAFAAGLVDFVGDAEQLATWVAGALGTTDVPLSVASAPRGAVAPSSDAADLSSVSEDSSAWAQVLEARRVGRPSGIDVAAALVDSWTELSGTDPTVRAGLASVDGRRLVMIAEDRYAGTGRPSPAGYRLAQRAIALASRRSLPIVTFIDTPGAEPGPDAENSGIARLIAETFLAMLTAPVPTIGVCVGEGGSGGALAFGATDRFLIQESAIFSVIGAEGAAAILHRDASRAPQVAEQLRLTSADLVDLGIADAVLPDGVAGSAAAIRELIGRIDQVDIGARDSRLNAATARWLTESV